MKTEEQEKSWNELNSHWETGKFREKRYGETYSTEGEPYDTPFRLKSWEREKKLLRKVKTPAEFNEE